MVKIVEEIPLHEHRVNLKEFIDATFELLEKNQVMTLPLKKVTKMVVKDGKTVKTFETVVNTSKNLRIIEEDADECY
jgi:hypothetical protein